jgi:hypothetical protein
MEFLERRRHLHQWRRHWRRLADPDAKRNAQRFSHAEGDANPVADAIGLSDTDRFDNADRYAQQVATR